MNIRPEPQETETAFIARAHESLAAEMPDAATRHATVTNAWRMTNGESDLERTAYKKYPHDKFVHVRDVPVFCEHEVTKADGTVEKYDRDALSAIIDRCNSRISNTGDFSALSDGHTPTESQREKGMKSPDVLGYSGPFRLGMVGNDKPVWSIMADEHHHKDRADELQRKARRSPEVWLEPDIHNRFMDPIAALGSDAPRLDMGTRYARTANGYIVEKYSSAVVSEPSANAGSVPDQQSTQGSFEMLSPDDVKQIVDAVLKTAPMQWVNAQMQASMAPEATPGENADVPGEAPADPNAPPTDAVPGGPPPDAGPPAAAVPPTAGPPPDEAGDDPTKKKPYQNLDEKMRYQRLADEHQALLLRVNSIEADKTKAERYGKLGELRQMRAFDLDKESARCASMTPDVFTSHCDAILENYQPIPIGMTLFTPPLDMPRPAGQMERYSKSQIDNAVRAATELANQGKVANFGDLLAQQTKAG